MLNRLIIISAALLTGLHVFSQDWKPLGGGTNTNQIQIIYDDTTNKLLLVGGRFTEVDSSYNRGIASWDGEKWSKFPGNIDGLEIRTICNWRDELILGGNFNNISGFNARDIVSIKDSVYNNLNEGFKHGGGPRALLPTESFLYVFGSFDSIGGIAAKSMARWDGQQWEAFAPPIMNGNYIIYDAVFYKGELYVAGNINHPNKAEFNEIVRWDGQEWKDVGGGIPSGGTVFDLEIYNDELYVGGFLASPADSEERCIARWDGEQWKRAGGGLSPNAVQIQNMHVWDDKLWVSSGPGTAGGLTQNAFLHYWDGTNWCQTKTVDQYAFALGSYRDTLIIGTSKYFDSTYNVQINHIAKLNMADYTDSCSHITTGVEEVSDEDDFMQLYPNPAVDKLFVQLNGEGDNEFRIYNSSGQQVFFKRTKSLNGIHEIDISDLRTGLYILQSVDSGKRAKFIIQ